MSLDQELREMNEPDEDDDDEADGDAKLPETPKPIEIQPIEDIDFDSIDIEELMKKNKSSLIDSSENLNVDKNPVLNIDYRVSYDDFKIGFFIFFLLLNVLLKFLVLIYNLKFFFSESESDSIRAKLILSLHSNTSTI